MNTVRLTNVNNAFQANVIKGALESEGIPCLLGNETMASYTCIGVDIFVNQEDCERARAILKDNDLL